eukprot:TRINITY_DN8651_c0_g1_i1.p1 TRINITY_DN8651_c0_g1~~TRINITY_DN8651_c0_g1_i1.p1  ORF type:complete len:575 (-),score=185.63 TRINITY_DN8651_c0_g1_i1:822-2546(-)
MASPRSACKIKRVAIIGAGPTGIIAGSILKQQGFEAVLFERERRPGGVWAKTYYTATLQNVGFQYCLPDFTFEDADIEVDFHPTAAQIQAYLETAIKHKGLDVRLLHNIESATRIEPFDSSKADESLKTQLKSAAFDSASNGERASDTPAPIGFELDRAVSRLETGNGWLVCGTSPDGPFEERFDFILTATGLYTQPRPDGIPGQASFTGRILTPAEATPDTLRSLRKAGKTVAVIGFGKTAVDLATDCADSGVKTVLVFREPRWLVPLKINGLHFTWALCTRMGTVMVPCWDYPTKATRFLHTHLSFLVAGFWAMVQMVTWAGFASHAYFKGAAAHARVAALRPKTPLVHSLRTASVLEPPSFLDHVASGAIEPVHGAIAAYCNEGLKLEDGRTLRADAVLPCLGSAAPAFPFLPAAERALLEGVEGGPQLYRHLIHPRIPGLAVLGVNHGFLHFSHVQLSVLWLIAAWRGELLLPRAAAQEEAAALIRDWKAAHELPTAQSHCGVHARFAHYLDVLCADLGVRAVRHAFPLSAVTRFSTADYARVAEEYDALRASARARGGALRRPVSVHVM